MASQAMTDARDGPDAQQKAPVATTDILPTVAMSQKAENISVPDVLEAVQTALSESAPTTTPSSSSVTAPGLNLHPQKAPAEVNTQEFAPDQAVKHGSTPLETSEPAHTQPQKIVPDRASPPQIIPSSTEPTINSTETSDASATNGPRSPHQDSTILSPTTVLTIGSCPAGPALPNSDREAGPTSELPAQMSSPTSGKPPTFPAADPVAKTSVIDTLLQTDGIQVKQEPTLTVASEVVSPTEVEGDLPPTDGEKLTSGSIQTAEPSSMIETAPATESAGMSEAAAADIIPSEAAPEQKSESAEKSVEDKVKDVQTHVDITRLRQHNLLLKIQKEMAIMTVRMSQLQDCMRATQSALNTCMDFNMELMETDEDS